MPVVQDTTEAERLVGESFTLGLSPLDSQRFGVVVARADGITAEAVPGLLSFCERHDVELLIARCDGADQAAARGLSSAGLALVESQITYQGPLTCTTPASGIREATAADGEVREATAADREVIAQLAHDGFGDLLGHYHADPRLSPEACRDTYVDWALRGLAGEAADVSFVAEVAGRAAAFGMFAKLGEEVRVVIATVASWARGRGIYVALLGKGMAWGSVVGARVMVGITPSGNIAAQRNLIAAGLRPAASTSTFHGWRDQLVAGH